ncbi:MAG: macrolide transporter ATP-binding protein [Dehalococcoidia bacterium]|nr:macrolide transporter ATP-binding protein [Dehalococcoidia bacterium]
MALIEMRNVVKEYRLGKQTVRALNGLNLSIDLGEFVALMGRSGSGKSTLLNLIGGLDRPTSGQVFLESVDLATVPETELPKVRRSKVGFVFQHFNLIATLTALENVMLPLKYAHVPPSLAKPRARALLAAVDMSARLDHRPAELSGGEQQRVAIARALVNDPAVLLADEPTGEVDTQTAEGIMRLIADLNQRLGHTVIVVTHDPLVAGYARRTVRLKDGAVESDTGR